MANPELVRYVETYLKGGMSEAGIKDVLAKAGWPPADVESAIAQAKQNLAPGVTPPGQSARPAVQVFRPAAPAGPGTPAETKPALEPQKPAEPVSQKVVVYADQKPPVQSQPAASQPAAAEPAAKPQAAPPQTAASPSPSPSSYAQPSSASPMPSETGYSSGGGRRFLVPVIIAAFLLLLLGGGAAFAYQKNYWPFAGAGSSELLAALPDNLAKINSADYAFALSIESEEREADAKPFSPVYADPAGVQAAYDRDTTRMRDLYDITTALSGAKFRDRSYKFPASLASLGEPGTRKDPSTQQPYNYVPSADRTGYTINVAFETQEGADMAKNDGAKVVSGKTMAVSQTTYIYKDTVRAKKPALFQFLDSSEEYYSYLPASLKILLNVGGTANSGEATDAKFQGGADVAFGDFSAAADAEFVKKADNYYFKVNKFPALFFDLTPIKGKWVKITPADLSNSGSGFFSISGAEVKKIADAGKENNPKFLEQARLIYSIGETSGALIETAPSKMETIDGVRARHMHLGMQKDKFADFYTQAAKETEAKFGDKALLKFDPKTEEYLRSPEFDQMFDYMNQNAAFDLWLDPGSGMPVRLAYSFRLVPDDKAVKLKSVQYRLKAVLSLKNVNQPSEITAPLDALSFDDFQMTLSGQTKEEYLATKQVKNISAIRQALSSYNMYKKSYPAKLDDLSVTYGELMKNSPDAEKSYMDYMKDRKLLESVPQDAYSGAPYNYTAKGADYTITYRVDLPQSGGNQPYSSRSYLLEGVVNGMNTATSQYLSKEKGKSSYSY